MEKFEIEFVIGQLQRCVVCYTEGKEIPFDEFCSVLDQFCLVFKALNSFLGIAFSDVQSKVATIRANNQTFKGHPGFLSFVGMEMQLGIHQLNGENNSARKAAKEYKKYSSTARNLLRMMWLLTFIKVTFTELKDPKATMPDILCHAYDAAFGEKHSWIIRKGAKLAIKASSNRQELINIIVGKDCKEEQLQATNDRFLERLLPVHAALWNYYQERGLTNLE